MIETNQFKDKRLLVLSNRKPSCEIEIIQIAKKLGIFVIVTNNVPDSSAKKLADKSYMVSTADIEGLLQLAKNEKIDGIMAGTSEFNIEKAITLSEKLKLPFYATREQWEITSNKKKFKEMCRQSGIPVVEEFKITSEMKRSDLDKINYPVIIKPIDNAGGKGISVCRNENEILLAYEYAMSFSQKKEILIEKYLTGDEISISFTIQNGFFSLSAISDKFKLALDNSIFPGNNIFIYPSKYLSIFQNKYEKIYKNMFSNMQIMNGFLFVQAFYENGNIIPFEMGFRPGGAETNKFISVINGIDYLEMLVRFSLTGEMSGWDLKQYDNPNFDKNACFYCPLLKKGKIKNITGLEKISKIHEIKNIKQLFFEGDVVDENTYGTTEHRFLKTHIIADSKETVKKIVKQINNDLLVLDENDNNMLFEIDIKKLDNI